MFEEKRESNYNKVTATGLGNLALTGTDTIVDTMLWTFSEQRAKKDFPYRFVPLWNLTTTSDVISTRVKDLLWTDLVDAFCKKAYPTFTSCPMDVFDVFNSRKESFQIVRNNAECILSLTSFFS